MIEVKDKADALIVAQRDERPLDGGVLINILAHGDLRKPKEFYQQLDKLLQEYVA